jgi:hypothetical protein
VSSTTTVPDGHQVLTVGRTLGPSLGRLPGGLLVATTGFGGDDQESEVTAMLEAVAAQVKPCPVVITASAAQIAELFAPALPATQTAASAALIYFQKGSLAGWPDSSLERITARLRDVARRTSLFVSLDAAYDVLRIVPMLEQAGIDFRIAAEDGTIAAEVHRPDGAIVTGYVAAPIAAAPAAGDTEATDVLQRSPRFDALVLEVVQGANPDTLERYLEARRAPLALIAVPTPTGEFAIQPRNWPGKQGFVAYADERALLRAVREMGVEPGSYAIAAMAPAKLFRWAASIEMTIMLCVFEDRADGTSKAWHIPLDVPPSDPKARSGSSD